MQSPIERFLGGRKVCAAIKPVVSTPTANARIDLYSGPIQYESSMTKLSGDGTLFAEWLPRPRVGFAVPEVSPHSLHALGDPEGKLSLPAIAAECPHCWISRIHRGVDGVVSGRFVVGPRVKLKRAVSHLVNWPQVIGEPIQWTDTNQVVFGRVSLASNGWRITLDPVEGIEKLVKEIEAVEGFGLTYVISIERENGDLFDTEALEDLLEALFYLLSFARGLWSPPSLTVGYDENDEVAYREWNLRMASRSRTTRSWFCRQHPDQLVSVFDGFLKKWSHPLWKETLRRAIWWHMSSNLQAGGCDGGVILSQVALELLAWVIYVEEGHILSRVGFETLAAADKLRLLLSWMKLSSAPPAELSALAAFGDPKIPYAPNTFVDVRNALVHPKSRARLDNQTDTVVESWKLGLWYTELAILKVCDHNGSYHNRLVDGFAGEVEAVPWK